MPGDLTSNDRAVFVFLDGLALASLFADVEWLTSGKPWPLATVFFVIAFVLALIAHNWSAIKPKFAKRLAGLTSRIERIAADYRYRTGSLFLAAFIIGIIFLSYMHSFRKDLDMYVMPRSVTTEQSSALQRTLFAAPSDAVVKIVASVADPEAMEYAGQLFNAIRAGGWNTEFQPVNPWDGDRRPYETMAFSKLSLALDQGLIIRTCLVGQPVNQDPKHPSPDALLGTAFQKAKIEVNGGGSAADCGQYMLYLEVGRRPRVIGEQLPALARLGDWIRNLSR